MTRNMGAPDRVARLIIAALLLVFAFLTPTLGSGILFWLALIVAAVFTVTAILGNCPLYRIFGISTCGN